MADVDLISSDDNNPCVDIIIPVRNGSDYIDSCLETLSKQTYVNFKPYFIIDKRSTDNTMEKIDTIISTLPQSEVIIRNEDMTIGEARNIGLKKANGDIIWFFDVDDYAYPTFLEEMVSVLIKEKSDIVFCNFFQEKKMIIPVIPNHNYQIITYDEYSAIGSFDKFPMYPWAHIQRRKMFDNENVLFSNVHSSEDVDQIIRELAISKKVCYYNKPLYVYYKRKNNSTHRYRQYDADSMETIARKTLPFIANNNPNYYSDFKISLLNRLMRQMAFVKYGTYKSVYKKSIAHELIKDVPSKTKEMTVFSHSKLLYYIILFPFTHWLWDSKKGLWDNNL